METEQLKPVGVGERLERIRVGDADALSALCLEIYPQYYLHLWHDNGAWYQHMRYSPAALARELADAQTEFYWIKKEGYPVGYLKINLYARPDVDALPGAGLEIERIYLLRAYAGMGLGQGAMAWAEAVARWLGRDYAFLYTMDSSDARWFYEKIGYEKRGETRLAFEKMKPEYRGMYLMIKELR
ncbi:GNAT family N-acetyltransferase [Salmonirosea aquatica]|uniref:GNAT family N-acetyltransferase n=1 Tax=Salmonirosea aquatica TaxID=2654236 RepID=A0A7C9FPB0_9BACT|nr:GNAT family N-acetyltransferase [Cytophagaceae bacterium SJW1-29]